MGLIASVILAAVLCLGQPAPTPAVPSLDNAQDAYVSFDALDLEPLAEDDPPMVLDYVETVQGMPNVASVNGDFVVESITKPGTFHVMHWSLLYFA